ncbi:2219_t:CDS:2 [Dentiscutata erythropus]|uniref:protein-serine/threonine phosphatase n=1 Tax=Dentiscutata erythropus TaxID=1348616 RepID=A0A9N9J9P7_9GLOM|nr:2219_t:CDS:2 [Dentiscutata erythropus]
MFDGHGGINSRQKVAKYSEENLHVRITNDSKFKTDIGNAGDSLAVLSEDDMAIPMSDDHKPSNPDESDRITEAGGFVEFGRVNSKNLALSCALGDFEFKQNTKLGVEKQIVTAYPDVKKHRIKIESTEFLVLACIWDCFKSQDVVSFIRKNIAEHNDLKRACEDLMERCLSKTGKGIGTDNMTIIIIGFLYNKTETEWYKWMTSKYGEKSSEYKEDRLPTNNNYDYSDIYYENNKFTIDDYLSKEDDSNKD